MLFIPSLKKKTPKNQTLRIIVGLSFIAVWTEKDLVSSGDWEQLHIIAGRELFSQTSLLVMIDNIPFYLNPGVANTSYTVTAKDHLSVVYNHICESLDHSCSLQYHFSVINGS